MFGEIGEIYFCIVGHGTPKYLETVKLRQAVLRTPLGLTYSDADLATEANQLHLVGFMGSEPVACALLQWTVPGVAKMRQVAVRQDLQGQGLGKCLVKTFEKEAGRRGARKIVLHARQTAVAFYRSLNYEAKGGIFEEIGIPHQKMVKLLDCDFP